MQNKATWLESMPDGFKVRVQFMPINAAEHDRCSRMLKNLSVTPVMVTTEGPMTVDLIFTDNPPVQAVPVEISVDPSKGIQAGRPEPPIPAAAPGLPPVSEALAGGTGKPELKPMPALKQISVAAPQLSNAEYNQLLEKDAALKAEHKDDVEANKLTDEQKEVWNKPDPTDKPA